MSLAFATKPNPGSAVCNIHIQPPPDKGHSTSISNHIPSQNFSSHFALTFHSPLMAPKLALLGLTLSVFRLILDLLERSDIDTFRLVSRPCSYI
jgi:hypothetical protein